MGHIEMPQRSFCMKATAHAQRWLVTHAVCLQEEVTETRCAFVLLEKRALVTEAEKQKSYTPPESQLGAASMLEAAGRAAWCEATHSIRGWDVPMGITIPLWFLAGDRHAVTVQMSAGKCLPDGRDMLILQEKGLAGAFPEEGSRSHPCPSWKHINLVPNSVTAKRLWVPSCR